MIRKRSKKMTQYYDSKTNDVDANKNKGRGDNYMKSTEQVYTNSALCDEIKQQLATTDMDIQRYKEQIEKFRNKTIQEQNWYDFNLDLDFSDEPKILDNRKYYYRFSQHYKKISLLERVPYIKVSLQDLSLDSIKALLLLVPEERKYVLKQAVGRIFEDINFKMYHDSILSVLKVKFIDGTNYDSVYTINQDTKDNISPENYFKEKQDSINQILQEQEKYLEKQILTNKSIGENENSNGKINNTNNYLNHKNDKHNKDNDSNNNKDNKKKPKITTYKYSNKGRGKLYEAIILDGKPCFLSYDNSSDNSIEIKEQIEENSRILVPPQPEEYPYEPYEFENIDEINRYIERAKNKEDHDSLFKKINCTNSKYNDQDDHKLNSIAIDAFHSYFQDRFSTVHYDLIIGGNGSGKSSFGDTFGAIAYRPVIMTDPTAPNLFRLLGNVEPGQCTIILEEAERIDQSQDLMNVLKTGYSNNGRVSRINTVTNKQEFFFSFGMKIIIAEKAPNQTVAKGVMDRTFTIHCYKGIAEYDIKEVLNPTETGSLEHDRLLNEITDLRKTMLIYRLVHFKDPIPDIDIGIYGRDKELAKPPIQLFNETKSLEIVIATLQKFLDLKNQRKESTIESALLPIIVNLISQYGNEFPFSTFWSYMTDSIPGRDDDKKPNEYHTEEYGTIYRTTITNTLRDIFGVKTKHRKDGNILIFDTEIISRISKTYSNKIKVRPKISDDDDNENNNDDINVGNDKQDVNNSNNEENEDRDNDNDTDIMNYGIEEAVVNRVKSMNSPRDKHQSLYENGIPNNRDYNLESVDNDLNYSDTRHAITEKEDHYNSSISILPSPLSPHSPISTEEICKIAKLSNKDENSNLNYSKPDKKLSVSHFDADDDQSKTELLVPKNKKRFNNPLISESDLLLEDYDYQPEIINNIYGPSDSGYWSCRNCTTYGDKWFMMKHTCKHNKKNTITTTANNFQGQEFKGNLWDDEK